MKGVLGKKILKMIGIAFATVFGVGGSVLGVMAAMGKFKTPVVYPTTLEFAIGEEIVIEGKTFNPEEDWETQFEDKENCPNIESFILRGTNSKSEHEVNKTKCLIWFEDAEASTLITLCDKNGKPLTPNSNLRYEVHCNEPIYYMINEVEDGAKTDGTFGMVKLYARSINETLKRPEKPKTIWIDRKVKSVFVDYAQSNINETEATQDINLGIDMSFDFKYLVDTPLSLKPISKEDVEKKDIEIYYVSTNKDADYGTDYYRVTPEACDDDNLGSPVAKILEYSNGTYSFQSSKAGKHQFILAVFPTYKSRTDYYTSIEGLEFENPNFHKTQNMLTTELNVIVEDIEINKAGLSGDNIVLDLYSTTNYIYLDNESEDNDLGLFMKKGEEPNQVDDYTRFDEVTMEGFDGDVWSNAQPTFSNGDTYWDPAKTTIMAKATNKQITKDLIIIDYICDPEDTSIQYYCNNGVAVLDTKGTIEEEDNEIKLLKPGSYLNFYIYNSTADTFTIADFDYTATASGSGRDKKWQISAKELPEMSDGESLHIGILVVNFSGEFHIGEFYDTIPVALNELELSYKYNNYDEDNVKFTANNATVNFSVTFDETSTYYPTLSYENIITDLVGTYTNFVYVVEESVTMVDTLPIKYKVGEGEDAKTYLVVGYLDDDGKFVNAIRVNENVSKENQTCSIYMLQLRHSFGEKVEEYINTHVASEPYMNGEEVLISADKVVKLEEKALTVKAEYVLNTALLTYTYGDPNLTPELTDEVYENTSGYTLTLVSSNIGMLEKIVEFYSLDKTFVKVESLYSGRITIGDLVPDAASGMLGIPYEVGNALEKPQELTIDIWLEINDIEFDLGTVTILNGSPDEIVLKTEAGVITLASNKDDVENDKFITAVLGYEGDKFTYSFKVTNVASEKEVSAENIFNQTISFKAETGFQDAENVNKGQVLPVNYSVSDSEKEIFNSDAIVFEADALTLGDNLIGGSGEAVLAVTIGETTGYILVKTDTSSFKIETKTANQNVYSQDGLTAKLSDFVKFTHTKNNPPSVSVYELPLTKNAMVNITNVEVLSYGDGNLLSFQDEEGKWLLKKNASDKDAILTIADDVTGWSFAKEHYFVPLSISFDVETIAGTVEIQVNFTSSINISVSQYWADRTIYSGTKISLQGTDYSMFQVVKANDVTEEVGFKVKNGENLASEFTLNDNNIGEIVIVPVIGENAIETEFVFTVKPNVIATVEMNPITSETEYSLSQIYDLKTYRTDITYGSSAENLYTKKIYYTDSTRSQETNDVTDYYDVVPNNVNNLLETDDIYSKLKFVTTNDENPRLEGGSKLLVGEFEELNVEKARPIKLSYSGKIIREDEFTIANKHVIEPNDLSNKVLDFITLKEYEMFASVDGFELNSIKADNLEFDIDDKFVITTIVDDILENVELLLTFKKVDGEQLLTYNCTINVLPYTPETATISTAYSGANYDLFGDIYKASEIEEDERIQKLYATGVKYSASTTAENVAPTLISNWSEGGSGYLQGISGPACVVNFKEISGDKLEVYVEFSITYANGKTYVYYVPLTIENRQDLTGPQYPESDVQLASGTFKFLDGYTKEALEISNLNEKPVDEVYVVNTLNYEAVLIYTDSSTVINFKEDNVKKLNRFVVTNEGVTTTYNTSTDLTVELIGYQNNGGMANYVANMKNKISINSIVLPSAQQGMFGTLIFKVSTASGNYAYYNIYVYCKGTASSVNCNNNLEVSYHNKTVTFLSMNENNTIDITNATYLDLVKAINTKGVYFSTFKTEYNANTTKVYLYHGVYTGEEETGATPYNYNGKQWQELKNDAILVNNYFNTVTLGLFMDDGVQEYCYGTITVYVQPENAVVTNGVNSELPNGYYAAEVDAGEDEIEIPFMDHENNPWEGVDVKIQSDGLLSQGYKLQSGCIVDKDFVLEEGQTLEDKDIVVSIDGTTIKLKQKVENDLVFTVKYVYDYTIAYVTYTYEATTIPEQTSSVITVGEFIDDEKGFNVAVEIDEKFMDTYNDEFKVSVGETVTSDNTFAADKEEIIIDEETKTSITFIDNVLTFPQSHEEQTFKITITYTKFDSENNTRTFTFKVLPGYEFDSIDEGKGLSSSNRKTTEAEGYETNIGSSLEFTKTTLIENKLYKINVADLDIYTNTDSKVVLTFDENSYVIGLGQNNNLEIVDGGFANFVHSAVDKPMTMTISVLDLAGNEYAKRNLYLTIAKTYTTLKAEYLTEGASHENVISEAEISNLHDELFNGRVVLIDVDGNEKNNLNAMGFANSNNPNYIRFTANSSATIKAGNSIQFNTVSTNTVCEVYLNNDAGIEENSVKYIYQIMANLREDEVDGLIYTSATGYHNGTEETDPTYISFVLDDRNSEEAYSKKFVLGTMLDARNETVFLVNGFTKGETIVGGYQNAIQYYSKDSGNYDLYLTLNLENKNIELLVERIAGLDVQNYGTNITKLISIGGVNGEGTIIENLTIVLSNHNIEERYKDNIDDIYAGYEIKLFEALDADGIYNDGKFIEDNGSSEPKLKYELANSSYTIDGQRHDILASQTTNDLFEYDKETKIIQTKAVPTDVSAIINFLVKDGDYVIKTVTYKLNIYLNMKFVVNGDETSALETDFVLTNIATDNLKPTNDKEFPITVDFISGSSIDQEKDIVKTSKMTYHKVLSVDLYRLKSQQNNFVIDRKEIKVALVSDISGDILEVTNSGIKFYKDFSGEIELKLYATTQNGEYVQYWTIYVTPILEIELAKTESSILQTSAATPFNSGVSVDLISNMNNKADEDVGVVVSTDSNFEDYINNSEVKVKYAYKIYTFAENSGISGLTSKQLFNLESDEPYYEYFIGSGNNEDEDKLNGHTFTIKLPNVPSTLDVQSYLVVYEVYVEYLGLTSANSKVEIFFVTYNVINKQMVDRYQYQTDPSSEVWYASDNVNISTRVDNTIDTSKYYLDLFYYQEYYNSDYTLTYTNGNIKLNEYDAVESDNKLKFNSGEFEYDPATRQLSKSGVVIGKMSQTPNNKETYYSVFKSDFRNIVEFKNFIDLYLFDEEENNIESVKISDEMFKLVEIADGRYGIDLYENETVWINNELNEKLCLVINDVETVTLPDFRLYINSSITPVGSTYTIAEMGLSNYFTPGTKWDDKIKIIGINTPGNDYWVYNAIEDAPMLSLDDYGTINIPNGTGNNTYEIRKVIYEGKGAGAYYSVTQEYYYLYDTESVNSLAVPNYTGIESYLYSVAYNPDADGNVVLNMSNAVKVWTMKEIEKDKFALVLNSDTVNYTDFVIKSVSGELTTEDTDKLPIYSNNTLTLSADILNEYKANNPTAKTYPRITATIKANNITLQLVIEFALPTV